MKTLSLAPLAAALLMLGPSAFAAGKAAAKETMKGEVVDMACYMSHEAHGEKHASCAKACLMGGMPAGLLGADGNVTLLLEDHNKKKPFAAVKELAGKQAEVSGEKVTRGGITAIIVDAVKKG